MLVPTWDPSVLFTPAGMNQFKDHFLGKVKLDFTRATTCQKCLRTGDIDNVGRTAYHHTFFEMLGNFSFGDYFKREAIHWAWEFLTDKQWLGIDPERLTVTVYLDDDEAAEIWAKEIGLPSRRASSGWTSTITSGRPVRPAKVRTASAAPAARSSTTTISATRWRSGIWCSRSSTASAIRRTTCVPLPSKNIDTGMGLERAAACLQGVQTNFHIDILQPIVEAAAEVCGVPYEYASDNGRRLRRITDHVRACTMAIHENVYPGPQKEKYVIRRLLRRAVLDGHQMGLREPFLYKLVPAVVEVMKAPYPESDRDDRRVADVIRNEEANFFGTIDAGLRTDREDLRRHEDRQPDHGRRCRGRRSVSDLRRAARGVRDDGGRKQSGLRLGRLSSGRWRSTARRPARQVHTVMGDQGPDRRHQEGAARNAVPRLRDDRSRGRS